MITLSLRSLSPYLLLMGPCCRTEDLPDDLTPFITRTSLDPTSGGGFGDVWKCDLNYNHGENSISALVSFCVGFNLPCPGRWLTIGSLIDKVALKAFRLPQRYDMQKLNRKISREIGILKILRHNNIVPLWGIATGFGPMPELRCLVSPWMPNGTLSAYLASKHNDLTVLDRSHLDSLPVASWRMSALDFVTANILIDDRGNARLIDFGLSTIVQPLIGQSLLAATSIYPGAICYAAPEFVLSDDVHDRELAGKIDIYSFGCVMLQILSGRPPWSEIKSGRLDALIPVMIYQGRGPQRPDGDPEILDSDWNFIQECLQFEPKLRPSADEVLDFVTHRSSSPDSCSRPPDDSSGASPHCGSNNSDTVERPPDSPHCNPNPSIIFEPQVWGSYRQSGTSNLHARVTLHNWLQATYRSTTSGRVRWDNSSQGLPHALTWHAEIYIDDMNYGFGTASTKLEAQEVAAMQALGNIEREMEMERAGRTGQTVRTEQMEQMSPAVMKELEDAMGIDAQALISFHPGMSYARQKFQWASSCVTTLQEDIAYSLFGIFGVRPPAIYGEKKQNALGRLLQEIVARSGNITVLDWVGQPSESNSCLPAYITSYSTAPHTLPSLSEDQIQTTILAAKKSRGFLDLSPKLFVQLDYMSVAYFRNVSLHLPCIVFPVTEARRRPGHDQDTYAYELTPGGLRNLEITTKEPIVQRCKVKSCQ
ncbi:kinase-like domain-containing protein [Suillus bovinus]|uniref:kinase-like domain-containing protein n=1 Tax=Suillus bovinus TaxID=48563 RepID=UPI001B85EEA2|nr:kinase-like domain-containing protein [Suillus bovinus]KAG2158176.1 kinase-like domain-containing protein [Suillus bovinus]